MSDIFEKRSQEPEFMDDFKVDGLIIEQTLRELEIINKWLGGDYVTINAIDRLINNQKDRTWRIIDLGCGGGEMLKLIALWARKHAISVELIGIDANQYVVEYAIKNTRKFPEISYITGDVLSKEFTLLQADIITATLFTHHFSNEDLIWLLQQAKKCALVGLAINDLHRHWFAYHSINLLTALFSKSSMVKNDAGLSVLRAFKKRELINILQAAGINQYSIKWRWAFRWQLIVRNP
jgi:2-polyprenyl-3-methyl-5-hydroxy-6-metoxy-1,4-benzoquinol methylase